MESESGDERRKAVYSFFAAMLGTQFAVTHTAGARPGRVQRGVPEVTDEAGEADGLQRNEAVALSNSGFRDEQQAGERSGLR